MVYIFTRKEIQNIGKFYEDDIDTFVVSLSFFGSFPYSFSNGFLSCMVSIRSRPTAQKMKFSIKDFFNKCDQIRSFLWIWSHLLKKFLMENFIFCTVTTKQFFLAAPFCNAWKNITKVPEQRRE